MPHLGVDGVGEVHRRGSGRKGDDPSFRREDVHLVLLEVHLDRLEELDRISGLRVELGDALHPRHLALRADALLVTPVRGDAELGSGVHLLRANLDLEGLATRSDHGGVQRLVQVELRRVDVVLETALDRMPQRVDGPEDAPAVPLVLHDDTKPDKIEDVVELLAADDHLLVDAPEVLASSGHLSRQPRLVEAGAQLCDDCCDVGVPLRRPRRHHLLDLGVALRMQRRESEILELPLHLLDAESVRQRRIDVQSLLCGATLLPLRHDRQRPHVVQAIRQLDHQNAPI